MHQDVVTYVKACTKCQRKHHNDCERKQGKLESIVTEQPHPLLVLDILGQLRRSGKYSLFRTFAKVCATFASSGG